MANQLSDLLGADANVARPIAKGEVKLYNIDDSVSPLEVSSLLSEIGNCPQEHVKTGNLYKQRNGLNSIMVSCPLFLAIKVAKVGKIRIG